MFVVTSKLFLHEIFQRGSFTQNIAQNITKNQIDLHENQCGTFLFTKYLQLLARGTSDPRFKIPSLRIPQGT